MDVGEGEGNVIKNDLTLVMCLCESKSFMIKFMLISCARKKKPEQVNQKLWQQPVIVVDRISDKVLFQLSTQL